MVFFLSIGLLIDLQYIWLNIWTVVCIVLFVTVFKTALNVTLIRMLGETWPRALLSGALLAQLGEFSFVLAALGLSVGAVTDDDHRLLVAVTVISLLFSPIWLAGARRLHRVVLLGITSGSETVRLTIGVDPVNLRNKFAGRGNRTAKAINSAKRWLSGITWRRPRR